MSNFHDENFCFLLKKNNGTIIKPSLSSYEDKIYCREQLDNNPDWELYCSCNKTEKLLYDIKNGDIPAIYPKGLKLQDKHSSYCPRSKNYSMLANKYDKGFMTEIDEDGSMKAVVRVNLNENVLKNKNTIHEEYIENLREINFPYNKEIGYTITISALGKYINTFTFKYISEKKINLSQSNYNFEKIEKDVNKFNAQIFGRINHDIFLPSSDKKLGNVESDEKNSAFFYGLLGKIEQSKFSFNVLLKLPENNKTISAGYASEALLNNAVNVFTGTYNYRRNEDKGKDAIMKGGFNFPIAVYGAYKKNKNNTKIITSLNFVRVSEHGLFCENEYEYILYNAICDYINENNLKSKLTFYKPLEFASSSYIEYWSDINNNYEIIDKDFEALEDGVFVVEKANGENKKYILEIFNLKTPEYIERKNKKIAIAGKNLLHWEPIDIPKSELEEKAKIWTEENIEKILT